MVWVGSVGLIADIKVELFARELLGKGLVNEEKDLLHVDCFGLSPARTSACRCQ